MQLINLTELINIKLKINCKYVNCQAFKSLFICGKAVASSKYEQIYQFQLVTGISQKFRSFSKYQYQSKVIFPMRRVINRNLHIRPSSSMVWQNVLKRRGLQNSLHLRKSRNSMTRLRNSRSNICIVIQQIGLLPSLSDCCLNVAPKRT